MDGDAPLMRVAVVGAGVSGLANARVLRSLGLDVIVYEARPDVGGVWSSTRGYPGLRIQNDKRTYALSDLPMPQDYPEHPTSRQVQQYLSAYAAHHDLLGAVRFSTVLQRARWIPERSVWRIDAEGPDGAQADEVDWLVLANGVCSSPHAPDLPGAEAFRDAGGAVVEALSVGDGAVLAVSRVTVLGWGKSAADIAVAAADRGAAVTVIARRPVWKLPYRLGAVPFQRLVITRLGEHLLWSPYRTAFGRVLRRLDELPRRWFVAALERRVRGQLHLERRGLDPDASIKDFSHLMTTGLFEAIDAGRIRVHQGAGVAELLGDGSPAVRLTDGTVVESDVLVTATGFDQDVSFLDERTRELLVDEDGGLTLHRHTRPARVPHLAFAGWMNSFRSPISAEIQALWIAALMHGAVREPSTADRRRHAQTVQLTHERAEQYRRPAFSSGVSILDQDAWIKEAGLHLPVRVVLKELLHPVDPRDYADLHRQLQERLVRRGAGSHAAAAAAAGTRTRTRTRLDEPTISAG